jgi:hypothetical protein
MVLHNEYMKTVFPSLVCLLVLSTLPAMSAPQASASLPSKTAPLKDAKKEQKQTVTVKKLAQYCALFGNIITYYEKDKLLLQTVESGMNVLYLPPYDKLYYYSSRNKKLCVVPAKGFVNQFTKSRTILTGVVLSTVPLVREKDETVKDLQCVLYKSTPEFGANAHKFYHSREAGGGSPKEAKAHYYKLKELDVRLFVMIAKLLDVPAKDGVPIDFNYQTIDASQRNYLAYTRLTTQEMSSNIFSVPPGLIVVKSPQEVLQGGEEEEAMELMMLDSSHLKKRR